MRSAISVCALYPPLFFPRNSVLSALSSSSVRLVGIRRFGGAGPKMRLNCNDFFFIQRPGKCSAANPSNVNGRWRECLSNFYHTTGCCAAKKTAPRRRFVPRLMESFNATFSYQSLRRTRAGNRVLAAPTPRIRIGFTFQRRSRGAASARG